MQVKDDQLELVIVRGHVDPSCCSTAVNGPVTPATLNGPSPACRYVNVELVGSSAEQGAVGTVLLENPRGKYIITHRELLSQVYKVVVTLCHLPSSFCYASPCLHNELPKELCQHVDHHSLSLIYTSSSLLSSLSPSITRLSHSQLKTYLFYKIFPLSIK